MWPAGQAFRRAGVSPGSAGFLALAELPSRCAGENTHPSFVKAAFQAYRYGPGELCYRGQCDTVQYII